MTATPRTNYRLVMDLDDQSSRLHLAYSEIDACDDVASALAIFQRSYRIDHVTYHLSQTTASLVDAPFVRTTYNEAWVARYLLRGNVLVDPIVGEGFLRQLPFDWREVEATEAAQEFLLDAIRHGIGRNGFSIPVADKSLVHFFLSILRPQTKNGTTSSPMLGTNGLSLPVSYIEKQFSKSLVVTTLCHC